GVGRAGRLVVGADGPAQVDERRGGVGQAAQHRLAHDEVGLVGPARPGQGATLELVQQPSCLSLVHGRQPDRRSAGWAPDLPHYRPWLPKIVLRSMPSTGASSGSWWRMAGS